MQQANQLPQRLRSELAHHSTRPLLHLTSTNVPIGSQKAVNQWAERLTFNQTKVKVRAAVNLETGTPWLH